MTCRLPPCFAAASVALAIGAAVFCGCGPDDLLRPTPPHDAGFDCGTLALDAGSDASCPAPVDTFCDDGGGAGAGYHAACTDAAFGSGARYPLGCGVTLPSDDPLYPGSGYGCTCTYVDGLGRADWLCPQ